MFLVCLLYKFVAGLLLTIDCDIEDMAEQVHLVVIKLHVERPLLFGLQKSLSCLVTTPWIREEEQVVGVAFAVARSK